MPRTQGWAQHVTEAASVIRAEDQALDDARYPYTPRLDPLRGILGKLDPPEPEPERAGAVAARLGHRQRYQ